MENGESRLDRVRSRKNRTKKVVLLVVLALAVGLIAGVGGNLLLGKPKPARVSTTADSNEKSKSTVPGEDRKEPRESDPGTPLFSAADAMSHVQALSEVIGPRPAGSVKESGAADYIVERLGEYGYTVEEQAFTTADGFGSRNVVGTRRGTSEGYRLLIGAHFDSRRDSKGAIDNGSGVGTVLELARVFSNRRQAVTLQFVFFGANCPGGAEMDIRLVGSRRFVELTGSLEKKDIVGLIAIDCVGQGEVLALRTQGTGLQRLKDKMQTYASKKNMPLTYIKSTSDSDNIPFENSQIPAVWVEWCDRAGSIPTDDTFAGVAAQKVQAAGVLVEAFVLGLTRADLEELKY